jgi:hypothetical protein
MGGPIREGGDAIVRGISGSFGLHEREALLEELLSEIAVSGLVFIAFLGF